MRYACCTIAAVVLVCVFACNGEQQRATVNIDAEIVQLKNKVQPSLSLRLPTDNSLCCWQRKAIGMELKKK